MEPKLALVLVPGKMISTTATRSIRKCKIRNEEIGGLRVDTEPTACGLDAKVWNLLSTGQEDMKMLILKKAGFESVEDLPRQP